LKIGILTYHRSPNYGALWQAYALSTFLYDKGFETSVVDYWPEYHKNLYKRKLANPATLKGLSILSKIKYLCYSCIVQILHTLRLIRTADFVRNYLKTTSSRQFDVCVYGSDQIWRKQHKEGCESYNPVYFGNDFIDARLKISFAASMGNIEIDTPEDITFIQESLSKFNAISVREQNLKNVLSGYTTKPIDIVCDPVFLLSDSQWEKVLVKNHKPTGRYIFYYNLEEYSLADNLVRILSKMSNLPIVEIRGYVKDINENASRTQTASPITFLSLLHDAELVVTSAFHGVALSLCFNKQFYYAAPDELADRAELLLKTFNIPDRRITDLSAINSKNIDYSKVNPLIEEYRTWSQKWLTDSIQG